MSHREFQDIDPHKFFNGENGRNADSSRADRENDQTAPETSRGKRFVKGLGIAALTATGTVLLSGGATFGVYALNVSSELSPKVETSIGVEEGHAEIINVDMRIPDITLTTTDTEATQTVGVKQEINGLITIPLGDYTATQHGIAETLVNLKPDEVAIEYDPEEVQMTLRAPNTALSTKVGFRPDDFDTIDETGNFALLPAEILADIAKAFDGDLGTDSSKLPFIGGIVDGTLSLKEAINGYGELKMATEIDEQCTPLLKEVIDIEQFKDNIRTAVHSEIVEPSPGNDVPPELADMPLSEIRELVKNAIVEMPEDFDIGPDEENIAKLEEYKKAEFFNDVDNEESGITCGVSEDATLTVVEEEGAE